MRRAGVPAEQAAWCQGACNRQPCTIPTQEGPPLVRCRHRSGAHGKAVTAMLPLASEAPGGPDMLLTASADGTLAVWDPSRTPVRGADRELAPRHSFKAHDNGITVRGGAQQAQRAACSVCRLWRACQLGDPGLWHALHRAGPEAKGQGGRRQSNST